MNRRESVTIILQTTLGATLLPEQLWAKRPLDKAKNDPVALYESFSTQLLGKHYAAAAPLGMDIACFIQNCLNEKAITVLETGSKQLQNYCLQNYSRPFETLTQTQQQKVMEQLFSTSKSLFPKDVDFAQQLRAITLFHFFNTEYGATEVLAYLPLPGRYEGNIPLTSSARSWTH